MRFLRDQAMQGAGFLVAIIVMLLQFPEHLSWLLPLSVLFIVLLYLGHRYAPDTGVPGANLPIHRGSLRNQALLFSRNWLTPMITIGVILVSAFFTVSGILIKIRPNPKVVKQISFQVAPDTQSLSLHTIVPASLLRDILNDVKLEIIFVQGMQREDNSLFVEMRLKSAQASVEDAGPDPQNLILEPEWNFSSARTASLGSSNEDEFALFDLVYQHTLFILTGNGGLIRLHVVELPNIPPRHMFDDYLTLYVSYIPSFSGRFDGLTEP